MKPQNIGLYAIIVIMIAFSGWPSWMALIDKPPLSYYALPFKVISPTKVGEPLQLTVGRCNNSDRNISYTFSRTLRNTQTGEIWSLPSGGSDVEPGCNTVQSRLNILPSDLDPGRYTLTAISTVTGNIRTFTVPWVTEEFEVIK